MLLVVPSFATRRKCNPVCSESPQTCRGCRAVRGCLLERGMSAVMRAMSSLTRGQRVTLLVAVLATAGAGLCHYAGAPSVLAFVIAGVALAALASIVSFATEQVGAKFGPAVTGFMQSTLGNLPELFIVIFALADGQVVVA